MSRHESVSCDSCLKGNFRGKRYKCVICYDYDLCAACYEAGATTSRHTADHPMQCILTRADFDIYYGGEAITAEQPQSFTCPYCGKMGYTEITLQEHVTTEHADSTAEVVCPICAALPGGDPNHVTDEFAAHLTLEHRAPRDFDEPMGGIRHVRRIPHGGRGGGGGVGGSRPRRTNMQFHSSGGGATGLSGVPVASRETMDPIAELLSQLSSVRSRAAAAQSVSSQLQQLEMQLQSTRQQLERLPRRQTGAESSKSQPNNATGGHAEPILNLASSSAQPRHHQQQQQQQQLQQQRQDSQFLLARLNEAEVPENERQAAEVEHADRALFVQELFLSSLCEGLRLSDTDDDDDLDPSPLHAPSLDDSPRAASPSPPTPPSSSSPRPPGDNCVKRNKVREPPPANSTLPPSSTPSSTTTSSSSSPPPLLKQ